MGVLDNLRGIMRSAQIKQKEQTIARDAVTEGSAGSQFLSNYETFKVALLQWIEVNLETKGNSAMVLRPKDGTDAAKFMRYTLEDASITNFYHVEQRTGGEFLYKLRNDIDMMLMEDLAEDEQSVQIEDENVLYL